MNELLIINFSLAVLRGWRLLRGDCRQRGWCDNP